MRLLTILFLMSLGGCATQHIIPSNRFMTPESQGGMFRGQFEVQMTKATQAMLITNNGSVEEGVSYEQIPRTGYMLSNSFFDALDFVWTHNASANSLGGFKIQLLGPSRSAKGAGHKVAVVGLMGGNRHETMDETVKFRLDGSEALFIYGYRINENVLPYASLSTASYRWAAELKSPWSAIDGQEPVSKSTVIGYNVGVEGSFNAFFAKAELTYQQLSTTNTKPKTNTSLGFSAGLSW